MTIPIRWLLAATLGGMGFASAEAPTLEMRVEEPSALSAPPIDPVREADPWKAGPRKSGPTRKERAAMEERRKLVEAMAEDIRARREALESAEKGEREGRIKDLQELLLDPVDSRESGPGHAERLDGLMERKSEAAARQMEKKQAKLEEKLEKAIENQEKAREKLEKALEKKEKALEKQEKDASRKDKPGKGRPGN
jgi:hypothetical protein